MEKSTLELVGQWSAYLVVIIVAFVKVVYTVYQYFKNFKIIIKDKDKNKDKDSFTVNVNTPISSSNLIVDKNELDHPFYFLLEQGKILTAIEELQSSILKEQLDYFSKYIKTIEVIAIKNMIGILSSANLDDNLYITYFSNFENFLTICSYEIISEFRHMCKTNHFSEYSVEGFRELSKRNIIIIEGTIIELLRTKYPQHENIENFKKLYEMKYMIRDALKDCFQYSRNISIEKIQKINETINCFETKVFTSFGSKYVVRI